MIVQNHGAAGEAYSWYDNDSAKFKNYGKLYTGNISISKNICPSGWHVPTAEDWTTLIDYLSDKGDKSGFHPIAGGYKWGFGANFVSLDRNGNWWSSSGNGKRIAWNKERQLLYFIEDKGVSNEYELSIRCVKD
jgi:hypothetical protein